MKKNPGACHRGLEHRVVSKSTLSSLSPLNVKEREGERKIYVSDCFLYLEIFVSFIGAIDFVEHWLYLPHSQKKKKLR